MGIKVFTAIFMASAILVSNVETYKVYDNKRRLIEVWEDRGETIDIYNPDMTRKGFIKKNRKQWDRYDKRGNREGAIQKDDRGEITIDE